MGVLYNNSKTKDRHAFFIECNFATVSCKATVTCRRFCDLSPVQQKCSPLIGYDFAASNAAILRFVLKSISKHGDLLQN